MFLDSNVLLSGIFFSGNESLLLKQTCFDFIAADVNYNEVVIVVKRKFAKLNADILKYALEKVEDTFIDINIVEEKDWKIKLDIARKYLKGNDQKILAADRQQVGLERTQVKVERDELDVLQRDFMHRQAAALRNTHSETSSSS